jgi:predicted permease
MDSLSQQLRHGIRSLLATPRLTLAALACTALGVGSAVFMFTLIDAVLFRSAPFPHSDRLVRVWTVADGSGQNDDLSSLDFQDLKRMSTSFESLEMVARTRFAVVTEDGTERMRGEAVSPGYFDLIALKPAKGRLFSADEYRSASNPVMLISYAWWQRTFKGRPDILGRTVRARSTYQGQSSTALFTIAGVMPVGFTGTVDADVADFWIPAEHFAPRRTFQERSSREIWSIGLLKSSVSPAAAHLEVRNIGQRLAVQFPKDYDGIHLGVERFGESWRAKYRAGLLMLLTAALLLLLIACTNIANLLLARLSQRAHELALRLILGAQRRRVLSQLLIESTLLSLVGGTVGVGLAFFGIRLCVLAQVVKLPSYVEIAPDARVIVLAFAMVLLTGALFGVLPAWFGSRVNASQSLRDAGRSLTMGRQQRRYGQVLVVVEIAFTFVLLTGSVLMLRSYLNLVHGDVGYRTDHLLRMGISLDPTVYPDSRAQIRFVREAKARLGSYPGVRSVAFIAGVLPPWFDNTLDLALNGVPNNALKQIDRHGVDADFFGTMGIALASGRGIELTDRSDTPPVAVVSRSLARFVAGGDGSAAVGKQLQFVTDPATNRLSPLTQIVGVTEDVRYHGPLAGRRYEYDVYVPLEQAPQSVMSLAIHTSVDPATLIEPFTRSLGRMAPTSPQHWISTMQSELALQYGDNRFYATLTNGYGACAAILAILGVYSVLANSVSRRFNELGVRLAIGAQSSDIVRMILAQGAKTLVVGLLVGVALAIAGSRLLTSLLHGVSPTDPGTFVGVGAILLCLGLFACYVPAQRAAAADPLLVLRGER